MQAQRRAVLVEAGDVVQVDLEGLLQGERPVLAQALPRVGVRHGIDLQAFAMVRRQRADALPQQVLVALVQAHLGSGGKTPLVAEVERRQHRVARAGDAAHPVVPALRAVVAHVELGANPALLQLVEQLLVHQLAVRVDLRDPYAVGQKRVHQLHEIAAHQRLAAGQRHLQDAAVGDLPRQVHHGVVIDLAQLRVGRGHVAVAAPVVALAGDRPVRGADEAVLIAAVLLVGRQALSRLARAHGTLLLQLLHDGAHLVADDGQRQVYLPIAQRKRLERARVDEAHAVVRPLDHGIGQFLPAPQNQIFSQKSLHVALFFLYMRTPPRRPSPSPLTMRRFSA